MYPLPSPTGACTGEHLEGTNISSASYFLSNEDNKNKCAQQLDVLSLVRLRARKGTLESTRGLPGLPSPEIGGRHLFP